MYLESLRLLKMNIIFNDSINLIRFNNLEEFPISSPERKILVLLVENIGTTCSRDILITEAWGSSNYIGTNSLNVAIFNLRKLLSPKGIDILTHKKMGYSIAEIDRELFINDKLVIKKSFVSSENTPRKKITKISNIAKPFKVTTTNDKKLSLDQICYLFINILLIGTLIVILDSLVLEDIHLVGGNIMYTGDYSIKTVTIGYTDDIQD